MGKEIPTINAVRTGRGTQLTFWCRFCHDWHFHGSAAPEFGAGDGHRVAHCYRPSPYSDGGYFIREVQGTKQGSEVA